MTTDLGRVIEHMNANASSGPPADPVALVARILSAHMDTLKWADHHSQILQQKTEQVAKIPL